MILDKFHGWTGGASALAVIIVGIAFFVIARKYVKWRITAAYFISIGVLSAILSLALGRPRSTSQVTLRSLHRQLNIPGLLYGN